MRLLQATPPVGFAVTPPDPSAPHPTMRTLLFWLLPIYNLVAAGLLVRSLRSPSDDAIPGAPAPAAIIALAWTLLAATVVNIVIVRDPRLVAAPYILFAANALLSWWSGKRSQVTAARA